MSRFIFEDVLAVTDGQQQQGDGSYMVRCPAHDDHNPSLHVTPAPDGKHALLHCFTGCEFKDVAKALELLGAKNGTPTVKITFSKVDVQGFADYCRVDPAFLLSIYPDLRFGQDWVGFAFPSGVIKKRIAGEKEWKWEPDGDRPPLWPMPPQSLPETIYLTAGESDCICLRAAGFTAFALTKGESSVPPVAVFETLKAQGVATIRYTADVDDAGRKAIPDLMDAVEEAGIDLRVLDLAPFLDPLSGEKDVRSLNRRVGVGKLSQIIESVATTPTEAWAKSVTEVIQENVLPINWLVKVLIPEGEVTLIAGRAKAGKTTFVYKTVEQMQHGGTILDLPVAKCRVLVWTERSYRINAERFKELFRGVDQPHVFVLTRFDKRFRGKNFESGLRLVMEEAKRLDCSVVVLDTLTALAHLEDENKAAEVEKCLGLIARQAEKFRIAVVVIHHVGKSGMIRGSTVYEAEPSTVVELEGEFDSPRTLKVRSNIVSKAPEKIVFTLDEQGEYRIVAAWESEEAKELLDLLPLKQADSKILARILEDLGLEKADDAGRMKWKRALEALQKAGKVAWTETTDEKGRKRKAYHRVMEVVVKSAYDEHDEQDDEQS